MNNFERFWKAYPKRNNKKVGRYTCQLWFEAKRPDDKTVDLMIEWIKTDISNRKVVQSKGGFYAEPCDPPAFLRQRRWLDEIGTVVTKESQSKKDRAEMIRKQELDGYKDKYTVWLATSMLDEIKGRQTAMSREFILLANKYPEAKVWALTIRPDLKSKQEIDK